MQHLRLIKDSNESLWSLLSHESHPGPWPTHPTWVQLELTLRGVTLRLFMKRPYNSGGWSRAQIAAWDIICFQYEFWKYFQASETLHIVWFENFIKFKLFCFPDDVTAYIIYITYFRWWWYFQGSGKDICKQPWIHASRLWTLSTSIISWRQVLSRITNIHFTKRNSWKISLGTTNFLFTVAWEILDIKKDKVWLFLRIFFMGWTKWIGC